MSARAVLVTGCSSGIGRATALLLAQQGFEVFAGVRRQESYDELAELQSTGLTPILLDVTQDENVRRALAQIADRSPAGLGGLINNAGVGLPAAVELSGLDEVRHVLEVNTLAPLRMIQFGLPLLRQGRGRIINISSINGTLAMPMVGAYSASKFALEALSDTLRVELRPWRMPVVLIRPGQVRTAIFDKAWQDLQEKTAEIPAALQAGYHPLYACAEAFNQRGLRASTTPEHVARVVLRALQARRPRTHYLVGWDAHGMQAARRVTARRLMDRILARVMGVLKPLP